MRKSARICPGVFWISSFHFEGHPALVAIVYVACDRKFFDRALSSDIATRELNQLIIIQYRFWHTAEAL